MFISTIIWIIIAVIVLGVIIRNVVIVPQQHEYVVEFLGKYRKTWGAGLHIKIPFLEAVVNKISLKEQTLDFPPQNVITKDNVTVTVDSVVFSRVFSSKDYTYGIEDALYALENLTATTLRNILGEMELDQTLSSRQEINAKMETILDAATDPWGLKVTRVEIKNINPPRDIEEAMSKQMKAEREKRQAVLEAEAHKESVMRRAEGDKEAKIMAAQAEMEARIAIARGEAESIRLTYEAQATGLKYLSQANIQESVLRLRGIDALKEVADGRATKIFMPTDLSDVVSVIGTIGETLGVGDAEPVDKSAPRTPRPPEEPCHDTSSSKIIREINEQKKAAWLSENAQR
ncbi:MAG: SPFH domain-containing protein [Bacillota bacterium]|nr:SPFH domain-containing protein [Bacillota bacterium]